MRQKPIKQRWGVELLTPEKDYSEFAPSQQDVETFAKHMFPVIQAYYSTKEGKRAFAEWKQRRDARPPADIVDFG